MNINDTVKEHLTRRAWGIAHKIGKYWKDEQPFRCIIAGGCLGDQINDVDLFPLGEIPVPLPKSLDLIVSTKNAGTYKADPHPIQICTYKKSSVEELVKSFDYAHIQAGAEISLGGYPEVHTVFFTDDFVAARATHSTWFCGSEYPLSSIIRAGKYLKSGAIFQPAYIRCIIDAMKATVSRGFTSYDDFKDQLDAVDLGLLPEGQREVGSAGLMELYSLLHKGPTP